MRRYLRKAIHRFVLRPIVRRLLRVEIRGAELDIAGPAIVVANHNSHVDTAVLLASFPTHRIPYVRPVAAADYFLRNRLLGWFSTQIVGIVPIDREGPSGSDPLTGADAALALGEVLILFPEGSRGRPGIFGPLKTGVARLAIRHPGVPVIPIWLDGCELAMPKGRRLPRPSTIRVFVGKDEPIRSGDSCSSYTNRLRSAMLALSPGVREAA